MTIDRDAAAAALRSVEQTESRVLSARGYRAASAPLLIWGLAWIVANGLCELFPSRPGTIWLTVDAVAVTLTLLAARRSEGDWRGTLRMLGAFGALAILAVAVLAVMPPRTGEQVAAVISLMVAFLFTLVGMFGFGARFVVLGLALTTAITGGYLLLTDHQYLWFGLVGGGALMVAGIWMRKA